MVLVFCLIYGHSFIKDADRIARRDYQPTDDDVLRAHLRTLGVQEYRFIVNHFESNPCPREWRLYDIGGTRSNVSCWRLTILLYVLLILFVESSVVSLL